MTHARAVAAANIALAKYWGKSDRRLNLPAVPSISLTIDTLTTETTVRFLAPRRHDRVTLDGKLADAAEHARVTEALDPLRRLAGTRLRAEVTSVNAFPTAAGLASSASGFAALVVAASAALGLKLPPRKLSALARRASASAARSIFGGYVELRAGTRGDDTLAARPIAAPEHWDLRLVIAITSEARKSVGSTTAMERTRKSSPYYDAWLDVAPRLAGRVKRAIKQRDLVALGVAMEQSTLAFHASAMAASPGIIYLRPPTLEALATVAKLRDSGVVVYSTMDAGPHVKALCARKDVARVRRALAGTEGVVRTLVGAPGPAARVVEVGP